MNPHPPHSHACCAPVRGFIRCAGAPLKSSGTPSCSRCRIRIARAAKEAQELLVSEDAADAAIHHAYDSALDAFDWGEK